MIRAPNVFISTVVSRIRPESGTAGGCGTSTGACARIKSRTNNGPMTWMTCTSAFPVDPLISSKTGQRFRGDANCSNPIAGSRAHPFILRVSAFPVLLITIAVTTILLERSSATSKCCKNLTYWGSPRWAQTIFMLGLGPTGGDSNLFDTT